MSRTIRIVERMHVSDNPEPEYEQGDRSERQGHAFTRRSRPRLRRGDVAGRRCQQGPRHGDRRGRSGHGDAGDDGPAAHGQRPAHRPWRLYLYAGGFGFRLCLQFATTSAPSRRSATSPSSGRASSATGWSRPRAKSRAAGAPESTMSASPWMITVIAEFRGHSRTIGGAWLPATETDETRTKNRPIRGNARWLRPSSSHGSGYRAEMDDAERASRDEIMALQTKRLAWSLAHAYDNVAHYRKAFDSAGVHPSDFRQLSDLAKFPFTVKTDLRDNYPVQHVRGAARKAGPRPRLFRHHRQADRGRIYPSRYRHVVGGDGALDPRRRRPYRHDHAQRLWLWPVHRRARRALRRRATGLHRGAGLRRHDRAAGAADQRFQARHHHGDAELHAGDPRRVQETGARSRANRP